MDVKYNFGNECSRKVFMALVRQPGFAGSFYLDDPYALRQQVESFLKAADLFKRLSIPKAIISPHAGYVYSGPVAASGFACLQGENSIKRVVVIAPSHQYPFYGIALTKADYYKTPLGEILIDKAAQEILLTQGQDVGFAEAAFDQEHSLEVQLPFLQVTLGDFKLVPVIVGQTDIKNVANLIELL